MRMTGWRVPAVAVAAGAVLGGSALTSTHPASADGITDKIALAQHQLAANGSTMTALVQELASAQQQQGALQTAIAQLDSQVAATEAQVNAAQAQLDAIDAALSERQDDLLQTRQRLTSDRLQLRNELVVIYKVANASTTFSNFINSGDFNSYWQHLLDVNRLGISEQHLVDSVTREEQTVADDVAHIAVTKQQKSALLTVLHGIVAQLDFALSTRQQAQRQLVALQAQDNVLLAQAELSARQVKAQIAQLQAQEAAALAAGGGNGRFGWPERGPITQNFGCTSFPFEPYDPNCSTRHFHSGLDIGDPCGTSLSAADSGIAHTYWSGIGYGNHVIIVHGNGWVSVYGHMSSFTIRDGQTVHRGQQIGHEGSTGNSSGCHVHFEVDLNGVAKNPLAYLS